MITIPQEGFLRLQQIIGDSEVDPPIPPIIPVCKSTWYAGIKSGKFPSPDKRFGKRISVWNVSDIRALISNEANTKPPDVTSQAMRRSSSKTKD